MLCFSEEAERSYSLKEMAYGWMDTLVSFTVIAERMGVAAIHVETADAGGGTDRIRPNYRRASG